jgi:hypothetical protein
VGRIARVFEASGIPTVALSLIAELTRAVLRAMLALLTTASGSDS